MRKAGGESFFPRVEQLFADSLAALAAEKVRRAHEEQLEREQLEQRAQMERMRAEAAQRLAHRTRVAAIAMACVALIALAAGAYGLYARADAIAAKTLAVKEAVSEKQAALVARQKTQIAKSAAARASSAAVAAQHAALIAAQKTTLANQQTAVAKQQTQIAQQQTHAADTAKAATQVLAATQKRQLESSQLAAFDSVMNDMKNNDRFDARVARLVGAAAYRNFPTVAGRDALLAAAESPTALGRVALPPWSLGAVAGHGQFIAVLSGQRQHRYAEPVSGSLVAIAAFPPHVLSRTPQVQASLLCGFDVAPSIALVSGDRMNRYDLASAGGPRLTASRSSGTVRAMACEPGSEAVIYVDGGNRLRRLDFRGNSPTTIAQVPGASAAGVRLSRSGRLAAIALNDGTVDVYDLGSKKLLAGWRALKDPGGDCSLIAGCAGAVAFSPDGRQIAWYDAGNIHVGPIASATTADAYPCAAEHCAQPLLIFPVGSTLPSVIGIGRYSNAPVFPSDPKKPIVYSLVYDNLAGSAPAHALWDSELALYLTEYNPAAALASNPYGSGIAMESLTTQSVPMIGTVPASQWSESYGLRGHEVLIPERGDKSFITYDLLRLREHFDSLYRASYAQRMRDSGDGQHAITFNYITGAVEILDIRPKAPVVTHRFLLPPVGQDEDRTYIRNVQIAYDPHSRVITMLSNTSPIDYEKGLQGGELRRYAVNGTLLSSLPERKLAAKAGLTPSMIAEWTLSERGNYVNVAVKPPNPDVMVSADGRRVGSAYAIGAFSPDEGFAMGWPKGGLATKYFLPAWNLRGVTPITPVRWSNQARDYMAIAPDGKTVAYVTSDKIELLDLQTEATYSSHLPDLPDIGKTSDGDLRFVGLSFSADSRFLLVKYWNADSAPRPQTAVYSLDPNRWMQATCTLAGRSLTARQFESMFPAIPYRDPCGQFADQMYRW